MAAPPRPDDPATTLGVDEARARIVTAFAPLPAVDLRLADALGLVLASDIVAGADLPPFANSAMDGYALRASDTATATPTAPVRLTVIGQAAAGHLPADAVATGTAVRIMTGAPLPAGADAVVRFEETDAVAARIGDAAESADPFAAVAVRRAARTGENVRPAGEDVRAGARALAARTRLGPPEIGLLAALGRERATVHRRPRVAILATGDEVCPTGTAPGPGQIRDSNGPMIAAFVAACGAEPLSLGVAGDDRTDLQEHLAAADDAGADLLLTTGGVSVGDYDLVKDVLRAAGRVDLWQVRLKPGKPLAFGRIGERPLIGLPGNPVAAAVAFLQFARPAILRMLGCRTLDPPIVQARLAERIENRGGRRHFVRVRLAAGPAGWEAAPVGPPGAGALSSLAGADGLLVIPEETPVAEPGGVFSVQLLDRGW